jgi:hypothetical protein
MDITTVAVGALVIGLGLFFLMRSLRPEAAAGKLKAMIEMWGANRGLWLYRIAYVGIPWFFGGALVYAGLRGVSLGRFFGA